MTSSVDSDAEALAWAPFQRLSVFRVPRMVSTSAVLIGSVRSTDRSSDLDGER